MGEVTRLVTVADISEDYDPPRRIRLWHYAELRDGRRVLLLDDRGYGSGWPISEWGERVEDVAGVVKAVVGPDEPVDDYSWEQMQAWHWEWIEEKLRESGVELVLGSAQGLPHDVEFTDRLRALLT